MKEHNVAWNWHIVSLRYIELTWRYIHTQTSPLEFFHNSRLVRRIELSKIYKKFRLDQGLNRGRLFNTVYEEHAILINLKIAF